MSPQVQREERVLQWPREATAGAEEAGAKTEPVCLAPPAAGPGVGPRSVCGGGHGGAGAVRG